MAETYTINVTEGVTIVRFSSEPGFHDIKSAIDDVAAMEPNNLRLWDFSVSGFNLSAAELSELAGYGKSKTFTPLRVAIVAPDDLAFGLSRMFKVYRENGLSEHRIFRTPEEAWAWLMEDESQEE